MTEIQGKSILVRVSARFELARVRVTGSRLYKNVVTVKKFPFMTESKFKTIVGGEMVHFGGEVTSYNAYCLEQNVDMYHHHLALKKFSEAQ